MARHKTGTREERLAARLELLDARSGRTRFGPRLLRSTCRPPLPYSPLPGTGAAYLLWRPAWWSSGGDPAGSLARREGRVADGLRATGAPNTAKMPSPVDSGT
jgi:hypothetical protein